MLLLAVLLMNGGVEAGESATKIARAWGYTKKGIPENQAINVFFNNNLERMMKQIQECVCVCVSINWGNYIYFNNFFLGACVF